jgi:organic radical activating enzyme
MKGFIFLETDDIKHFFPQSHKDWLAKGGTDITNEALLKWLDAFIDPKEWVIKITGGEPGLYPEINLLIAELNNRGFYGLIETNGSTPIQKSNNFKRIAAWHKDKPFPINYDVILIIKNQQDNWKEKEKYCKENKIPYQCVVFKQPYTKNSFDDYPYSHQLRRLKTDDFMLDEICCIYAAGQVKPCPTAADSNTTIFDMVAPSTLVLTDSCKRCTTLLYFERFLDDNVRELFGKRNKLSHLELYI